MSDENTMDEKELALYNARRLDDLTGEELRGANAAARKRLYEKKEYRRLYQAPGAAQGLAHGQRLVLGDVLYALGVGFDGWEGRGKMAEKISNKVLCDRWDMSQWTVRHDIIRCAERGVVVDGPKKTYVSTTPHRLKNWEEVGVNLAGIKAAEVAKATNRPEVRIGPPWDKCYEWARRACVAAGMRPLATCVFVDLVSFDRRCEKKYGRPYKSLWRSSYQIAGRVGADRASVRKALNDLKRAGLIKEVDKPLVIVDGEENEDAGKRRIYTGGRKTPQEVEEHNKEHKDDQITLYVKREAAGGGHSVNGGGRSRHWAICWAMVEKLSLAHL